MPNGLSRKTIADLRQELGELRGRLQSLEQRHSQLNASRTKRHVYISAGVSLAGFAFSAAGGGPLGAALSAVSAAYGLREVAKYRREVRQLDRDIDDLRHRILLKSHTIRQIRQNRGDQG